MVKYYVAEYAVKRFIVLRQDNEHEAMVRVSKLIPNRGLAIKIQHELISKSWTPRPTYSEQTESYLLKRLPCPDAKDDKIRVRHEKVGQTNGTPAKG